MPILDNYGNLADGQSLNASGATTNVLDMLAAQADIGVGKALSIALTQTVAPAATGTYTVALRTSATAAGGVLSGAIQTVLTRTIQPTALAGSQMDIPIPNELGSPYNVSGTGLLQYIDLYFTLGGTNPVITFNAKLVPRDHMESYNPNLASGFTVK